MVSDCQPPEYETWIDKTRLPGNLWTLIRRLIPLGVRLTRAEEIAGTVAFLLSRESRSVNGKLLQVDGGYIHLDLTVGAN